MRMGARIAAAVTAGLLSMLALAWPAPAGARGTATAERVLVVRPGDTLGGLLGGAGVNASEAEAAVTAIASVFPPRSLQPGQEVAIHLDPAREDALVEVEVEPAPGTTVHARLRDGQWHAEQVVAPRRRMLARAAGTIDGGLFPAATAAGLPAGLALSLIRTLGHEVDFQRDIQPGDRFSILFERLRGMEGDLLGHGRVLHVELVLSGRHLAYWRHETRDGTVDWFDAEGRSLRGAFLRTPLDGARVSSGFGMRNHPVLGFTRLHAGIDFAAPAGTPVYASADGTVISARAEGAYGRIVRLRHADATETRYAHLSRFDRSLAPGRRVKQGDVIGAVGSTGLSTGPHLHYEVVMAGRPVHPAGRTARNVHLVGRDLQALHATRRTLAAYASRLEARTEIAMAD